MLILPWGAKWLGITFKRQLLVFKSWCINRCVSSVLVSWEHFGCEVDCRAEWRVAAEICLERVFKSEIYYWDVWFRFCGEIYVNTKRQTHKHLHTLAIDNSRHSQRRMAAEPLRWLLKNKRDTHRCCGGTANGAPLVWSCSCLLMNMTCICSCKPLPNTSKAILACWWALGYIRTWCQVERSCSPTSLSDVIPPMWVMHAGALTSVLSTELYSRGIAHTAAHLAKVA